MSKVIGIIGAMDAEVKNLCESLQNKEEVKVNNLVFYKGLFGATQVVVVKSGIGKVNAALCAQLLIIKFGVNFVINSGIAGAAGKGLDVFDFVVSTEAVYHDVDACFFGYKKGQVPGMELTFKADEEFVNKAVAVFNSLECSKEHKVVKGRIASGDQFISEKSVKNEIIKNFEPMCVEMEGAAIAQACYLNNTPFVIIRCLSDCADESVHSNYQFNEDVCAAYCADFIKDLIKAL